MVKNLTLNLKSIFKETIMEELKKSMNVKVVKGAHIKKNVHQSLKPIEQLE